MRDKSIAQEFGEVGTQVTDPVEQRLSKLAIRIAQGDQPALGELYDCTVGQLFSLARAIVRNEADAEEIVVDTYTQVWQSAATYDLRRGTVRSWLVTICRSRALDRLRQQRRQELPGVSAAEGVSDGALEPGPEALLEMVQENSAVHQALKALTPLRRQLLALAFFQGLSHSEIAGVSGLPVGTVKSHIRRALAALRSELSKEAQDASISA